MPPRTALIENARVNLRRANGSFVTWTRTNIIGSGTFEVVPGAEMVLEADYHGARWQSDATLVASGLLVPLSTTPVSATLTCGADPCNDLRVDLRRANGSYITNARTNAGGSVSFEALPDAEHLLRATFEGTTWTSNPLTAPATTTHTF